MKPKTIVCVLDTMSLHDDVALARALALAQWYGAHLHVVHVGLRRRPAGGTDPVPEDFVARVGGVSVRTGVPITPAVVAGEPVRAIADYIRRVAADLVVVGNKARRSRGYWSGGAFAAALGKAVASPTLAIGGGGTAPDEAGAPFRRILIAVDFSAVSFQALSAALVLAQQSGGQLRLLHVLSGSPYESVYSESDALRLIRDRNARVARVNRHLEWLIPRDASNWSDIDVATVAGESHEGILAAASDRPTDLIVLGLPRRSRLEDLVSGSTVQRVLRHAKAPVLLVPGRTAISLFDPADDVVVAAGSRQRSPPGVFDSRLPGAGVDRLNP